MMNKNKIYNTLKLRRGERKNDELHQLSLSKQDFEYRRLYIKERELDLHVFFSRAKIANMISWSFLGLAIWFIQSPLLALCVFGLGVTARIVSIYYQKQYNKVEKIYSRVLKLVESVIREDYGVSFS